MVRIHVVSFERFQRIEVMKKNKQNHKTAWFALNALAASMFLVHSAHALQSLDDTALRQVNGQDGVHISTTYNAVDVEQFYWEDDAGRGSSGAGNNKLRAVADDFKIRPNTSSGYGLGTDYKINVASTGGANGKSGLNLDISINPSLIKVENFMICDTETSPRCSDPIGNFAIQNSSVIDINFKTRDGLFSKTSQSSLNLGLKNANIYLGQTDVNSQLNQLILKNMNFNFLGKGVMFVDPVEGFKIQTNAFNTDGSENTASLSQAPNATYGYVDFTRVADPASDVITNGGSYGNGLTGATGKTTNSGLNLEFMLNKDVLNTTTGQTGTDKPYMLDSTKTPQGAKGLIRVGASGRMVNGSLQLRGTTSNGKDNPSIVRDESNLPTSLTSTNNKYGNPNGTNILGQANSATVTSNNTSANNRIIGNSGIGFRMKAEFTKDNDSMLAENSANADAAGSATTLEIGGAGLNTYGFEFGNLTGLQSGTRGSFDSGNVYINLADTKSVLLPANYIFQTSRFGNGQFLTNAADYTQNIHIGTGNTNPYSLLVAVRGAEFQAISRRGRFTNSATYNPQTGYIKINEHNNNEWGLALPFYNLNANMAMFGTKVDATKAYYYNVGDIKGTQVATSGTTPRLGFSLAMSTDGIDRNSSYAALGNKTTSILVIDGGDANSLVAGVQPTNYYMGLRNIDMLLKGNGSIGVENGSLNVSLENMLIVMAAEVAAGYLPGTTYKTCVVSPIAACSNGNSAPTDNFSRKDDVLFGLKLRAGGNMNFSLIPNSEYKQDGTGNRMNIVGEFELTKNNGNTIQISDPIDGSTLGLDNLEGKLAFNNAIVIAPDTRGTQNTNPAAAGYNKTRGEGIVSFNAGFTFNPDRTIGGVFRARDINLYPPNTGNAARLGELAITGGRLTSEFSIMPRN